MMVGAEQEPEETEERCRKGTSRSSRACSRASKSVTWRPISRHGIARSIVVLEPGSLPYGGEFHGLEGVRRHAAAWLRTWSPLQHGDERKLGPAFVDAGDDVVVRWRLRARAPDGDRTLNMPMVSLYKLRDGKVVLVQMFYTDTVEVLQFLEGAR